MYDENENRVDDVECRKTGKAERRGARPYPHVPILFAMIMAFILLILLLIAAVQKKRQESNRGESITLVRDWNAGTVTVIPFKNQTKYVISGDGDQEHITIIRNAEPIEESQE